MAKREPQPGQIKLVSLDLDGTLLRSDNSIGPRTLKALEAAHRKGVKVALNSGRMTPSMELVADLIPFDVYIVSYNGAAAKGLRAERRRTLFERSMPLDVAIEMTTLAKQRGLHINYYLDELIHCETDPVTQPYIDLYRTRTGSPFRIVERIEAFFDRAPMKVLFVVDPPVRDELEAELRPKYERRATVTKTEPEYLEFLHPQVDKGVGLAGLAQGLGLPIEATLAVGDADNDAPMLLAAGWGVAMANAKPLTRSRADAFTEASHNEDGVAEALERWVL